MLGEALAIVFGYLVGRRRARRARRKIVSINFGVVADSFALSARTAAVVGAGLGLLLFRKFDSILELLAFAIMCGMCIENTLTDFYTHRLVRSTTRRAAIIGAPLLILAALKRAVDFEAGVIFVMFASFVVVLVIFTVLARVSRGGIGSGDVRLAAVLAMFLAYLGAQHVVLGLALGFILGGLVAVAMLLSGRANRSTPIAFGPYLCLGAVALVVGGQQITNLLGV